MLLLDQKAFVTSHLVLHGKTSYPFPEKSELTWPKAMAAASAKNQRSDCVHALRMRTLSTQCRVVGNDRQGSLLPGVGDCRRQPGA